jgi:hypothetical protein
MPDNPTPLDMGFAEFAAKLIEEVFEAVAAAEAEQRQKLSELEAVAAMDSVEYGARFLDEPAVDEQLADLFPSKDAKRPSAIFEGALYRAVADASGENPPILATLGMKIEKAHLTNRRGVGLVLNKTGVRAIRAAVRSAMAEQRLEVLRAAIEQGVPRVAVEGGRINAKLTFQIVSTKEATSASSAPTGGVRDQLAGALGSTSLPFGRLAGLREKTQLQDVRLVVRQANEGNVPATQMTANVFGEVEILFKTIV